MGECQSKAIGHTQESFKHIQAYLEPCYPDTFKTVVYPEHIQNLGIFPTL